MHFPDTVWTSIRKIRKEPTRIMETVVRRYRPPIYEFALRQKLSPEDAEDVVQEVFLQVCQERFLDKADQTKGKFRALLLAVTNHVIASHRRHELADRRDRRREVVLGDFDVPEDPPEDAEFDRLWARNLMDQAFVRLADDPQVRALRLQLDGKSHKEIATELGRTASVVANWIHRSKIKLEREIRLLIAEYSAPKEVSSETRRLTRFLRRERP